MSSTDPISVVYERFEDLVSRGLRSLIESDPNFVVAAADVPHPDIAGAIERNLPKVVILSFGELTHAAEVRELSQRFPDTRFLVLGNRPSPSEANQLLAFGASACLSKQTQGRDILNALHLASRGLHVLPQGTMEPSGMHEGPDPLTSREAEVLQLLQNGRSNAEIALALHVAVETVRTHARHIYRKLGVNGRRELIIRRSA